MESGVDKRMGWEYTVKDWEYIFENPEKLHYLRLMENDQAINITRDNQGKIKNITFDSDSTYDYTNFFQFAELIKTKIRATGVNEVDLVGHSMGGLDIISAVALDREDDYPEVKGFIKTDPLNGVGLVVTVATPYKGSGPANLVKYTPLDEIFRSEWSDGVRKQCENMAYDSAFIKIINQNEIRTKLLKNAKIGVYTFSGKNDGAVTSQDAFIEDTNNHAPFELVMHSQRMGITQDPRLHFALFSLFMS